jgi:hypothetical protein
MMQLSPTPAIAMDHPQGPPGSLAWDPEYAEYLWWLAADSSALSGIELVAEDVGA